MSNTVSKVKTAFNISFYDFMAVLFMYLLYSYKY